MKNILHNWFKLLIAFSGFALILNSCSYKEVADADLPAAKLYMPAAVNGIFNIDDVPQRLDFLPTPGQAYRFTIDLTKNKMIVPLGVYRSGLDRSGAVSVDIAANSDTITKLVTAAKLPATTTILPTAKFSVPASCTVANGSELGTFNLEIDLDYLRSFPDAVIALGVGISSSTLQVNPLLKTTIIVIYTKLLIPTANFSASIDVNNKAQVTFLNTSTYAVKNLWNFGDSKTDTVKVPVHSYAASGTYTVTYTAVGALGTVNQSVKTATVIIALVPLPNFIYTLASGNKRQIILSNSTLNAVSYSWNFGDGSPVSTEKEPSHTFAAAGTFTVVLTATSDNGTVATKSVAITIL